jgi:hypothetical protein
VLSDLHPYKAKISYIVSKHYPNLPISIVRPCMVVIPVTLDYGLTTKAAVSLLLQLSRPGKQFQLRHILMRVKTAIINVRRCSHLLLGHFSALRGVLVREERVSAAKNGHFLGIAHFRSQVGPVQKCTGPDVHHHPISHDTFDCCGEVRIVRRRPTSSFSTGVVD